MIADAILVLVGDAGERVLNDRIPSNFTKDVIHVSVQETGVLVELDRC